MKISVSHITGRKRDNDFDKYYAKEIHHLINNLSIIGKLIRLYLY